MPLELVEAGTALAAQQLLNPTFPFLDRTPTMIRGLMLQPDGTIVASEEQVRVEDRVRMTGQMKAFLQMAFDENVDLTICPEYSCTWDALTETINAGLFPPAGKIWALACESATPEQLANTFHDLQNAVQIVFDNTVLHQNGNFVDLLVYLFRTHRQADGAEVRVALVQAKTAPMGGTPFEQLYLKTGHKIYRFTNANGQSNSLVGLLCSDTLHPDFHQLVVQLQADTLLLHLQLNPNPSSAAFRQYRSSCCQNEPRTAEILCLNWARGTSILENGVATPFITEPKTILFRSTNGVLLEEPHIEANHAKGCYLTNWQTHRTAAFIFSPDPHLFHIETTKPSLVGPAVTAIRTGPHMRQLFRWQNGGWGPTTADDRFKSYWFDAYPELQPLAAALLPQYLRAERLIQLSVGYARTMDWAEYWCLKSFELADDDTTLRLTLCWSDIGMGVTFRERCLSLFRGFMGVVSTPARFANRLVAFKNAAFRIEYRPTPLFNGLRNLHLEGSDISATGIYLGQLPSNRELNEIKKRTMHCLSQTRSDTQHLAIWYLDHNGALRDFMDEDVPKFNADPDEAPVAIDNTQS